MRTRHCLSLLTLETSGLLFAALLALGGCSGGKAGNGGPGDGLGGDGDDGSAASGGGDGDGDSSSGAGAGGSSGSGGSSGAGGSGQYVPTFPGAGTSPEANDPLVGGMLCDAVAGADAPPIPPTTTRCFFEKGSDMQVYATIEQALECVEGTNTVRLRLTFDPGFNDNTFGAGSIGWPARRGHRFQDLVSSDHAELVLVDGDGNVAMQFKMDYISEDPSSPSGYSALGVLGGDGSVSIGNASDVVEWSTSLDRNLNERGYAMYVVDSPATDADYTANPETPEWDYRVVFEVWVDLDAFGASGFSGAFINYVHASPAKGGSDTVEIEPGPCPPPPCPPDGCEETPPVPGPNPDCPDDPDGNCGGPGPNPVCPDDPDGDCVPGPGPNPDCFADPDGNCDGPGPNPDCPDDPDGNCDGPGPNPACPDDPDAECTTFPPPPSPIDPCTDNDPDTFCGDGTPGDPQAVPAYCDLYPTDPACQLD